MIALICSAVDEPSDQEFMIEIYEKYKRLMFSVAKRFIDDTQACQDIVQDSILKLIEKIPVLRGKNRYLLSDYISTTVKNTAINYLRREAVIEKHSIGTLDEMEDDLPEILSAEDYIIVQEKSKFILNVLDMLSDDDRILLEGRYILEYTDEELAEQLLCKPSSIRMKMTRARKRAIALFRSAGQEEGFNDAT